MLNSINIKKFLYIENISIELTKGLNVFTGETGVGKSLIIDAIEFALGKKGSYEEGDFVELVFDNVENDFTDEEKTLIVARQIKNGKNIYYLNGKRATVSTIKEAVDSIIEIHGQHAYQSLFSKDYPRQILDIYSKTDEKLKEYQDLYKKYKELENTEKEILQKQSDRLKEIDIINFQLAELENANLQEGEKEKLEERYKYLSNIEALKSSVLHAKYKLIEEDESLEEKLSLILKTLSSFTDINENIKNSYQLLEEAKTLIKEAYYNLDELDFNDVEEMELYQIEERINLLNKLELKYNTDIKGLIDLKNSLKQRLEELNNLEFKLPEIQKEKEEVYKKLLKVSDEISSIRKEKGLKLQEIVRKHLEELALKDAQFIVKIENTDLNPYGKDKIEFLFSANKGLNPQPLSKVASGGELSRISLVLKLISNKSSNTIIFDEIDTGIGGKTAIYMAQKINKLSESFQILLITHLPQIAIYADRHFIIEKITENEKTKAVIKEVGNEGRELEIARMLSGIVDEKSIQHAKQLLSSVK
jgi:DNA repair protein RecN (Recombination protein N)